MMEPIRPSELKLFMSRFLLLSEGVRMLSFMDRIDESETLEGKGA